MTDFTLSDILRAVRRGERPDYDDLRYALRAMESLNTFIHMDLRRMMEHPKFYTPHRVYEETFNREKRALNKTPKEWLGPGNDPDGEEYQQRRKTAEGVLSKVMQDD